MLKDNLFWSFLYQIWKPWNWVELKLSIEFGGNKRLPILLVELCIPGSKGVVPIVFPPRSCDAIPWI